MKLRPRGKVCGPNSRGEQADGVKLRLCVYIHRQCPSLSPCCLQGTRGPKRRPKMQERSLGAVSKTKEDYRSEKKCPGVCRWRECSWFVPHKLWLGLESDLKCGRQFKGRTNETGDLVDFAKEEKGQWLRTYTQVWSRNALSDCKNMIATDLPLCSSLWFHFHSFLIPYWHIRVKYGEGKEYSCRDTGQQDMDLMGVDSPLGLIHSRHSRHSVAYHLRTGHSDAELDKSPPLQELRLVGLHSYRRRQLWWSSVRVLGRDSGCRMAPWLEKPPRSNL